MCVVDGRCARSPGTRSCAPRCPARRCRRRDAMQGTFIGVLMSATLPARLGEPSRALIVARRIGRARETLPVVLGTIVSQTLLNLLALAMLGAVMFSTVELFARPRGARCSLAALAPLARSCSSCCSRPVLLRARRPIAPLGAPARPPWRAARRAAAGARRPARLPPPAPRRRWPPPRSSPPGRSSGSPARLLLVALGLDDQRRARRRGGGAVRRQRHRRRAGDAVEPRRLPGRLRRGARRRLRRHAPPTRSPTGSSCRRSRSRPRSLMGMPALRQGGPVLAGRAPARDALHAGAAAGAPAPRPARA